MTPQPASGWESLGEWWLEHITDDPVFATDVLPLAAGLVATRPAPHNNDGWWLDVGCGDGRVMRGIDVRWVGCDVSQDVLRVASAAGAVVCGRLPDLSWLAAESLAGAVCVLVAEHLSDVRALFAELYRTIAPGGSIILVANHPAFTSDGSGPIMDPADGEVMWRWGSYFRSEVVDPGLGNGVEFHHRRLGEILNSAGAAGWVLSHFDEHSLSDAAMRAIPGYVGQAGLPRLIGIRWHRP